MKYRLCLIDISHVHNVAGRAMRLAGNSLALALFFCATLVPLSLQASEPQPVHAIAMHGEPRYGADFRHFSYVNPDAPKGGRISLHSVGTFDSLNPFVERGVADSRITLVYDSLLERSADEPFTEYGLLATKIILPDDRSWVEFILHPDARFHDGKPVTAHDVVFTFEILRTQGSPFYQAYYGDIDSVTAVETRRVRFEFSSAGNMELPLIVGQAAILPKHFWEDKDFSRSSTVIPLGSGPYRVARVDAGRSITYERVEDYWARNHPIKRGRHNFDAITVDYYRDGNVALEAFKSGAYDFRLENNAKDWAVSYSIPAVRQGMIQRENLPHRNPTGMQGFALNTRRPMFTDPRVRQALAYLFDFEWTNRNLFYNAYARSHSYFSNSEMAAVDLPGAAELRLLEPWREQLPDEVFTQVYRAPETDGSGAIRDNMRIASSLLRQAGWEIQGGRLTHRSSGSTMDIEFLIFDTIWERIIQPYRRNLERMGIESSIRVVDVTQYVNRVRSFDFDVVVAVFPQSTSPGNEQRDFWHSAFADQEGSRNLIGIKDPVVDALVESIIAASDREELVVSARALDRVLQWGHYVVPHWHITSYRVAYWDLFAKPSENPPYDLAFDTWWVDPEKSATITRQRGSRQR